MAFVVNNVLVNGVDLVLEKEFASFVLQVMKIHPLNQTLSMILCVFRLHLFLAAFACASLKDKGYWGEEDPFDAQQSFFKKEA
nr:hypothetical protein [Tanacetum cinerariifolium]